MYICLTNILKTKKNMTAQEQHQDLLICQIKALQIENDKLKKEMLRKIEVDFTSFNTAQTQFLSILKEKRIKNPSVNRWELGLNSPTLASVEELCSENNIEIFFHDGNLFKLLEFTKNKCEEMGHNMNYQLNKICYI